MQNILRVHFFASDASSLPGYFLVIFLPVSVPESLPTDCRSVCLMGTEDLIHSSKPLFWLVYILFFSLVQRSTGHHV